MELRRHEPQPLRRNAPEHHATQLRRHGAERRPELRRRDAAARSFAEWATPRAALLAIAAGYGTNFAAGAFLNAAAPAAAATSARFLVAAAALAPHLARLPRELAGPVLLCGACDALGYVAQSVALVDTPPATVSLLGALTVVVAPARAFAVDGERPGAGAAAAAALTLGGVFLLERVDGGFAPGDGFAALQAVGFGASFYVARRTMADNADAALAVTAGQCSVTALLSALWALGDGAALGPFAAAPTAGWLLDGASDFSLPGLLLRGGPVAGAVLWTGLVTTALVRFGENSALAKVPVGEATVLVGSEPLWAALWAAALFGTIPDAHQCAGGVLILAACVVSARPPREDGA